MSIIEQPQFAPMVGDPDDHRPNTSWAIGIGAVDGAVRINAFFATTRIGIAYLERNPSPGSEKNAPAPPYEIDSRSST